MNGTISSAQLIDPSYIDPERTEELLKKKKSYTEEYRFRHKDGSWRWVEEHGKGVYRDNELIMLEGVMFDITERKTAEAESRQSAALLQGASDLANVGYAVWCYTDNAFVTVSDKFAHLHGYDKSRFVDERFTLEKYLCLVHPDDLPKFNQGYGEREVSGDDAQIEFRIVWPDGNIRHVREWSQKLDQSAHSTNQRVIALQDITQQKLDHQALKKSEALLRSASDIANLAYATWNRKETKFESIPEGFAKLFGLTAAQFRERCRNSDLFSVCAHPSEVEACLASYRANRDSTTPYTQEFRVVRADDQTIRSIKLWVTPIPDISGDRATFCTVVAQDITDLKEAEHALRQSEERFRDFAESASDWLWEMDADLRFIYMSERAYLLSATTPEEVIGAKRTDLVPDKRQLKSRKWIAHLADMDAHKPFKNFEYSLKNKHGATTHIRTSGKPIFDQHGVFQGYRGTGSDITESYKLNQQLSYQANHDSLTGLVNRREFENRLHRIQQSSLNTDAEHALCYLDLDHFKAVNDTCGHLAGDQLLKQLSELMLSKVRKRDTMARIGGDEFAVLMEHCTEEQAYRTAENLRAAVQQYRFRWEGKTFQVGVSIGLVPINKLTASAKDVLNNADAACYAAKEQGRNRIYTYSEDARDIVQHHSEMLWISQIHQAIDNDELILFAQRIKAVKPINNCPDSFEILLRLKSDNGELVSAEKFLPAAERYSLSTRLDRWVLINSFKWLVSIGSNIERLSVCSINLSGTSLADYDFLDICQDLLKKHPHLASKVCFEITETAAVTNLDAAINFINTLKTQGCCFALDDFGSGLSSFAYLKNLPVDYVKIDGAFVRDIVEDLIDRAMVKSINEIGHVMGKKTIAEFVESRSIMDVVESLDIDYVQGYFIGKPIPLQQLTNDLME